MPVTPNQGSVSGGTSVIITGVNLGTPIAVHFGSKLATFTPTSATSITAVSPGGQGAVDVWVTTSGGDSNTAKFYYIPSPVVESLSQLSGPVDGENTITINGRYLSTTTSVSFGNNPAVSTVISDSQLTVVVPEGSIGNVPVVVTTSGGVEAGLFYSYISDPVITSLTPISGSVNGGSSITINGSGLENTTSVSFNGINVAFGIINSNTISAITLPNAFGPVDVVVTTTSSNATSVDGYTFIANPSI